MARIHVKRTDSFFLALKKKKKEKENLTCTHTEFFFSSQEKKKKSRSIWFLVSCFLFLVKKRKDCMPCFKVSVRLRLSPYHVRQTIQLVAQAFERRTPSRSTFSLSHSGQLYIIFIDSFSIKCLKEISIDRLQSLVHRDICIKSVRNCDLTMNACIEESWTCACMSRSRQVSHFSLNFYSIRICDEGSHRRRKHCSSCQRR